MQISKNYPQNLAKKRVFLSNYVNKNFSKNKKNFLTFVLLFEQLTVNKQLFFFGLSKVRVKATTKEDMKMIHRGGISTQCQLICDAFEGLT